MSDLDRTHRPRHKPGPWPAADHVGVLEARPASGAPAKPWARYALRKRLPAAPVVEPEIAPGDLRVGG